MSPSIVSEKVTSSARSKSAKFLFQSGGVEIRLKIMSNWGHPSRVGLTEIQLLHASGSLLPVPSTGVTVLGGHSQSGSPAVLFNGRAKVSEVSCNRGALVV